MMGLAGMLVFGPAFAISAAVYFWPTKIEKAPSTTHLSASEIADTVAEKLRLREAFTRELSSPIQAIHVIIHLSDPTTPDETTRMAGVLELIPLNEEENMLFFGFRPGVEEWRTILGNEIIKYNGVRSMVWSFPRNSNQDTTAHVVDNYLIYRFDFLDGLEAGATMVTPFKTIADVDHATVLFKATPPLVERLNRISVVINDFVVFELKRLDIVNWQHPAPPMNAQIRHMEIDPSTGKIKSQEIVKTIPMNPNLNMPEMFWEIPFFTALTAPNVARAAPPLNSTTSINFSAFEVRQYQLRGSIFVHKAGSGSAMIMPGERGLLPRDPAIPPPSLQTDDQAPSASPERR
jgi:hypothetical protein